MVPLQRQRVISGSLIGLPSSRKKRCSCRILPAAMYSSRSARRRDFAGAEAGAVGDRERRLVLQVAARTDQARHSSRLNTTGTVRGTDTGFIFAINSTRSSVTSKKNFNPVRDALSEIGELP